MYLNGGCFSYGEATKPPAPSQVSLVDSNEENVLSFADAVNPPARLNRI